MRVDLSMKEAEGTGGFVHVPSLVWFATPPPSRKDSSLIVIFFFFFFPVVFYKHKLIN